MDFKVEDHLKAVPELPELIRTKKNRPPKMAVVDEDTVQVVLHVFLFVQLTALNLYLKISIMMFQYHQYKLDGMNV